MSISAEVELKIKLSTADLERVFSAFSQKHSVSSVSSSTKSRAYYDTPDLDLYQKGISLRLEPGGREQTLKIEDGSTRQFMSRKECMDSVAAPAPSLSAVSDPAAQTVVKPFMDKTLIHIFTAAIERRAFDMDVKGGQVEVAFDVGALVLADNRARQDFHEIEIEIKQGGADVIAAVKKEIFSLAPSAQVQTLSKSAQGSRLYLSMGRKRKIS